MLMSTAFAVKAASGSHIFLKRLCFARQRF
jgi:hypothetical protein